MIQALQIVALLQGLFLLVILLKNRENYDSTNFFYLYATLLSLFIFLLTDTNSHLVFSNHDLFLVDNTLFITFLLLFVSNFNSRKPILFYKIGPFFIPVLLYGCIEIYEAYNSETYIIEVFEHLLYLTFAIYLALAFYRTIKLSAPIAVKIPFIILILSLFKDYSFGIFSFFTAGIETLEDLNSLFIFEIALVFYYLSYLFVINHDFIKKQAADINKYKNSSLNSNYIGDYKKRIIHAMENDRVFTNENLSLQAFSEIVDIPKHYISEILNVHLNTNFQDFVNEYRVEEFIKLYSNPENDHFSIMGIATSVGFKTKATFNANFKKIKGISPSEYKQQHKE